VAWSTAALTAGTTVTLAPWDLEFDLACSITGAGGAANTTLRGLGNVGGALAWASPFGGTIPASNTAFTNTIDASVTQYLYLSAACGTSSGSNLIQLEMLKVYGEN
jgi:hypothetical protein